MKPVSHNRQSDNCCVFFFFKPTRQRSSSKNNWCSGGDGESCSNSKFNFCWKRSREMPMKAIDLCVGSWSVWVWLIMTVNQFTTGKVLLMENRVDPGWRGMCDFLFVGESYLLSDAFLSVLRDTRLDADFKHTQSGCALIHTVKRVSEFFEEQLHEFNTRIRKCILFKTICVTMCVYAPCTWKNPGGTGPTGMPSPGGRFPRTGLGAAAALWKMQRHTLIHVQKNKVNIGNSN